MTIQEKEQCEYIVPEVGMQKEHRCVFRASQGRFCNTHQRIFNQTGKTKGQTWRERIVELNSDAQNILRVIGKKLTTNELEELRYLLGVRTPLKDDGWQNKFDSLVIERDFYKEKLRTIKEHLRDVYLAQKEGVK
jgi:hypothetical protein